MYCSSRGSCRQAVAGKKGSTNRNRYHPPTSAAKETPTTHANNEAQSNSQPQRHLYSEIHHNDNRFFFTFSQKRQRYASVVATTSVTGKESSLVTWYWSTRKDIFFQSMGIGKKTSVEQKGITLLSRGPSLYPAAISLFHERLH